MKQYDRATAEAIFGMCAFPESFVISDDGVFLNEEFRAYSPQNQVFDWTPAYDMDWAGSPNPLTAPILPIPFTANELAACMLDGPGQDIQNAIDRRIGYPLDEEVLQRFTCREREVANALGEAYALAAEGQSLIGEFDYKAENVAHALARQAEDANVQANTREGVFQAGLTFEEASQRRALAVASNADLSKQAERAMAATKTAWFAWRKAMVRHLLQPSEVGGTSNKSDAVPTKRVLASAVQDAAILDAIRKAGYDPLKFPKNPPGKPGIKAKIRNVLDGVKGTPFAGGGKRFEIAWGRLLASKQIVIL